MSKVVISIARDFSRFPFGRYRVESESSGEEFRDDIFIPALESHEVVEVDLNGIEDFGPSFLEEVFGGAVRKSKLSLSDLGKRLIIKTSNDSWLYEIRQHMKNSGA